ncbi:thioredoxin [Candidozyma auris]|nr:thioredoxin [[Candida] auris]QEL60972.1 thioredoxin [[Candida] auris]
MPTIQFIKTQNDFDQCLQKNKYLVAQFTASWCGPCQAIKPMVDDLYNSERYQRLEIVRVDLDANREVASEYNITSVPTFIFFENGKETSRVKGASPKMIESFDQLNSKAVADPTASARSSSSSESSANTPKELASLIPKGYSILNDVIHFAELVSLNTLPLVKKEEAKPSDVFKLNNKHSAVVSDADSQTLFFLPLNNICKVYSVLLRLAEPDKYDDAELELDEDELKEETQVPQTLKVWTNKPGIMSFEDAASDNNAPHVEKIDLNKVKDGWYEAKLKFVRFQGVQNLTIFIDGEDEDKHIIINGIVIVGTSGDSREQGSVQPLEDE